jgi:hypothetical protein
MNLDVLRYLVETRTDIAELAGDRAASVFKVAEALIASNGDPGVLTLNQFVEYELLLKVLIEDVPCEGPLALVSNAPVDGGFGSRCPRSQFIEDRLLLDAYRSGEFRCSHCRATLVRH